MKKIIALFLVFSLLALSGSLYAKKKGAQLVIDKKEGQSVAGELIAVKNSSLLLLNSEGADESVDIENINRIRIVKKSKFGRGAGFGLLSTGVVFLGIGTYSWLQYDEPANLLFISLYWLLVVALPSALVGGLIGVAAGTDEKIQIEGMSDTEIKTELEKLRKKARVPNYQ